MKVNSNAIYGTKPIAPFKENNICMTQNKEGNVYLFYLAEEGEEQMPSEIIVNSINPKRGTKIRMLGSNKRLKWEKLESGFKLKIPKELRNSPTSKYAWTLKVEAVNHSKQE